MWNGSVWVTIAVGTSPISLGPRRDPGGDEHRVQPAADAVDPIVGLKWIVGLQRQ